MNALVKLSSLTAALVLSGCMSSAVNFEQSSIPLNQGGYTELSSEVSGTCTQVSWLFFTFGRHGSSQRHALRDAMAEIPGTDALVSVAVDEEIFMLVPFVLPTFVKTRVTGTPVKVSAR